VHEVPVHGVGNRASRRTPGVWQRGRLRLPVKQIPERTRWFESIRTHQIYRISSTGRAAASNAEGSRFDPVVRCPFSCRRGLGNLCTTPCGGRIPALTRSAALQILAIQRRIAAVCALHLTPNPGAPIRRELCRGSLVVEGICLQSRYSSLVHSVAKRQDVAKQRAEGRAKRAIQPSTPFPDSAVGRAPGC
jgi:hypothetical protein